MRVIGCIADLMFATRLRDAAGQLGHDCEVVGDPAAFAEQVEGADLAVVDLGNRLGGALEALQAAVSTGVTTVAYGEHVRPEVLEAARQAGADSVLTRGEFARHLPALLGATREAG